MRSRPSAPLRFRRSRGGEGFTLLELLVVMGIIAILASVLLYAVRGGITMARNAATVTILQKVNNNLKERRMALDNHLQSLETQFDKYYHDTDDKRNTNWLTHAAQNKDLARVLLTKDFVRRTFPQTFYDIAVQKDLNDDGVPDQVEYGTYSFLGDGSPGNGTESAEVMFYAITGEPIQEHASAPAGKLPVTISIPGYMPVGRDAFSTSEYADTDDDGLYELVDGWGNPLRFYRWPTRLIRPGGYFATPPDNQIDVTSALVVNRALPSGDDLNRDPDDPLGLTTHPKWSGAKVFENPLPSGAGFHTLSTYHTMLVVSAGPDGVLGLNEPTDYSSTYGYLANPLAKNADGSPNDALLDDITNLNAKAGGN